jgi:2-haloacid dehalogenase
MGSPWQSEAKRIAYSYKEVTMQINRREFLDASVAGLASSRLAVTDPLAPSATRPGIRAIAFDAFTTFDPRPIAALAEQLFPGRGAELGNAWRTRQFEYTWLRTLMRRYVDFWRVTEDALIWSAQWLKLDLSREKRERLMQAFLQIKAWPDALPALTRMKDAGIRLRFLSNLTAKMIDAAIANSGLKGIFEPHLTTDIVSAYKPDPRAYQMGIDAFGLAREEIAFAAFGGWDAAGAKSFGYPTFWVNRAGLPVEELGVAPDATGETLTDLANFVLVGSRDGGRS